MQNNHSLIIILILTCIPYKSLANEYQINTFDGGGTSNSGLINRTTPFVSNDIADFVANINATSNIGTAIPNTTLQLNGNNYTLYGNSHEGFELSNSSNFTLENLNVTGFKGISHTDANLSTYTGGSFVYENSYSGNTDVSSSLTIKNSNFTNNFAINPTEEVRGGVLYYTMYKTNTQSLTNTLNIINSDFENNYVSSVSKFASGGILYYAPISTGYNGITGTSVNISGSTFKNNYATCNSYGAEGGVIDYFLTGTTSKSANNNSFIISNSTFENNYVKANSTTSGLGGVIYAINDNAGNNVFNIINSTFNNNYVTGYKNGKGGVLYYRNWYAASDNNTLSIDTCTFMGNKANGGSVTNSLGAGGALFCDVTEGSSDSVYGNSYIINNSTFSKNEANSNVQAQGGAIFINYDKIAKTNMANNTTSITNSIFSENKSISNTLTGIAYGGAIYNYAVYTPGSTYNNILNITGSTFENNSARGATARGGAIYNYGITNITSSTFSSNSAGEGGAIYNIGELTLSNLTFANNTANNNGGAIYSTNSTLGISDTIFSNNSISANNINTLAEAYVEGGAIYNDNHSNPTNTMNISLGTFTNNSLTSIADGTDSNSQATNYGGAIYNEMSNFNISNSTFTGNNTYSEVKNAGNATAVGGAFFNGSDDVTTTDSTISNSNFNQNHVYSISSGENGNAYSQGGAIFNFDGNITATNTNFTSNYAYSESKSDGKKAGSYGGAFDNEGIIGKSTFTNTDFSKNYTEAKTSGIGSSAEAYGGAIFNYYHAAEATPTISNSTFSENYAKAESRGANSTSGAFGGAIVNFNSNLNILNSTFKDNYVSATSSGSGGTTEAWGGAICNYDADNLSITNSTFSNNSAINGLGGAIYNYGNLYLIADGGTTSFSGNTDGSGSNAIYTVDSGSVNLNAGNGGYIKFDDAINSNDSSNELNINTSTSTLRDGNIIFNNKISNYTVTLSGGTFTLGEYQNNKCSGSYFDNCTLTLNSGILNCANGNIDSNSLNSLTSSSNTGLLFDANLNTNTYDKFIVSETVTGGLTLKGINILADSDGTDKILTLFNKAINTTGITAYTNNFKYTADSSTTGAITLRQVGAGGLKVAVDDSSDTRSFSNITSESVNSNLGTMNGKNLTILGNQYNINGNSHSGMIITSTQTLNINNVGTPTNAGFNNFTAATGPNSGAINNSGTTNITTSTFTANKASGSNGGAVYNSGSLNVSDSYFGIPVSGTGNSANNGGAIYNNGIADTTNSTFQNNTATTNGGAVYNSGTISALNETFQNNSANNGGAIYNNGNTTITGGTFSNNTALNNGGAIYNDTNGTVYLKASDGNILFSGNTANNSSNAIYNKSTVYLNTDTNHSITFNDAITSSSNSNAINVNSSAVPSLINGTVNFNNSVTNSGLNISNGTVNFGNNVSLANDKLIVSGGTVNFTNQHLSTNNDVNFSSGTMNFNMTPYSSSSINDKIIGSSSSTININTNSSDEKEEGTFHINNQITGGTKINIYEGNVHIGNESYINGDDLTFYGCTVNTQNNIIGTLALGTLSFQEVCDHFWSLDVDLAKALADKITATSIIGTKGTDYLTINNIKLLSGTNSTNKSVNIADATTKDYIKSNISSVHGNLYKYGVSYDSSLGNLNFTRTGFDSNIIAGGVAQTEAFILQTSADRQVFNDIENFMAFPLAQRESSICCALSEGKATGSSCPISGNGTFSPIYACDLNKGVWMKTFTSFQSVPLRNGPDVSTIEYGTLIGGDTPLKYIKHGIVGNTMGYVGYLGSNQNYDNVGISQNGVIIGLAQNLIKGNNFLTLMANAGGITGIANTQFGHDNFSSILAGAAMKCGHNFEFKKGEYIIQPNFMAAYTYTYTPAYNTTSGYRMTTKPLNGTQIAPGFRLIKNLKNNNGQVYFIGSFVYNILDNTRFSANNLILPELAISPYVEYGVGYQKVWKERFNGFFQAVMRGGGINGIGLQFGLRWAI